MNDLRLNSLEDNKPLFKTAALVNPRYVVTQILYPSLLEYNITARNFYFEGNSFSTRL